MKSLDYIGMKPLKDGKIRLPEQVNTTVQALAKGDEQFALYLHRQDTVNTGSVLEIDLPDGSYSLVWTDTKSGTETAASLADHNGGLAIINSPAFIGDIALRIMKAR